VNMLVQSIKHNPIIDFDSFVLNKSQNVVT
jgi:hypothetical protein